MAKEMLKEFFLKNGTVNDTMDTLFSSTTGSFTDGVAAFYASTTGDYVNTTSNDTDGNVSAVVHGEFTYVPIYSVPVMVVICILLAILILTTILGNVFVIAAIILERSLQGVSNYLILSLAVTDLFVATIVMPISLVNELSVYWYLGNALCDFWISVDVLCCTASILHLVAISLDRFWGVSNIDYIRRRCARQILVMIAVVWSVAFTISIPPLFGWKDTDNGAETNGLCQISQDLGYTVFSTVGAFYLPLFLMVFLNFKIYVAARSRIRKKNFSTRASATTNTIARQAEEVKPTASSCSDDEGYTVYNGSAAVTALNEDIQMSDGESGTPLHSGSVTLQLPQASTNPINLINYKKINGHTKIEDINRRPADNSTQHSNGMSKQAPSSIVRFHENNNHKHELQKLKKKRRDADRKRKDKMEMKRERKAAKVLGIITGAFIACWLPFFSLAVILPFCGNICHVPPQFMSFCLWLGYANSSLNPILYTIFNPSFRKAFHKIIYGKYRIRR